MKKRGRGYASIHYGCGNAGRPNPASAFVELLEDGSCLVRCGAADIGQGSDTVLCQVAAETLGISPDKVSLKTADTLVTPEAGVSSASRQTYVSGNAVRLAAEQVRELILAEAADELDCDMSHVTIEADTIRHPVDPACSVGVAAMVQRLRARGVLTAGKGMYSPPTLQWMDPETGAGISNGVFTYGTQMVEVEVDTETGEFEVLRVVAAHDVGCCINPMATEGQIEGGVVFGLGYGEMEEILWDDAGRIATTGFDTYLIPTALDVPDVVSIVVEEPDPNGPFGAKGTGEPTAALAAAALVSAIKDAAGVELHSLPVTAEKVYWALRQKELAARRREPEPAAWPSSEGGPTPLS